MNDWLFERYMGFLLLIGQFSRKETRKYKVFLKSNLIERIELGT